MKHLVRKYVRSSEFSEEIIGILKNAPIDEKAINDIKRSRLDGFNAQAVTEDNKIVQTFKYINGENVYLIQEPDPIIIYFDTAVHFHRPIREMKTELFSKLSGSQDKFFKLVNGDFYVYFSTVCNHIIFLFLAIEAFINKSIPVDFEYRRQIQNKKVELYNKLQIQRNIEFSEKIKSVLPEITRSNFVQKFSHKYDLIVKLKEFRDEIIHTKSFEEKNSPNFYQDLFVMSLDFDFDNTLFAVRDFINYYQPNLIEECDCGNEN